MKIQVKTGREKDATAVILDVPFLTDKMSLKDYVARYGADVIKDYAIAAIKVAVQRVVRGVLNTEGKTEKDALAAGLKMAENLTAPRKTERKTAKKTRAQVEAEFKVGGFDINTAAVQAIIDGLFQA